MLLEGLPAPHAPERTLFGELTVAFDRRVLRPRPWTRLQSLWGAQLLEGLPDGPVLELCAGAGHIGLLTVLRTPRPLVMVDQSPVACEYARLNANRAGIGPMVEVRRGSVRDAVAPWERFALIIADPPWVPRADVHRFPEDPVIAIDGGDDGLRVAWECIECIDAHLLNGGAALLQLGNLGQLEEVRRHLGDRARRLRVVDHKTSTTSTGDSEGVIVQLEATVASIPLQSRISSPGKRLRRG